jgi:hypothetical protein
MCRVNSVQLLRCLRADLIAQWPGTKTGQVQGDDRQRDQDENNSGTKERKKQSLVVNLIESKLTRKEEKVPFFIC